jgi:hypothetical protein
MAREKEVLLNKKNELIIQLNKNLDFIKGTLSEIKRGEKKVGQHLTYKDANQTTHTHYVSSDKVKDFEEKIKRTKKLWQLLDKLSEVNIKLLKVD